MVKKLMLRRIDCEYKLGQFLDEKDFTQIIDTDCDVYAERFEASTDSASEENCVAKFRKNYFTKAQQSGAYLGLKDCAKETQNRGMAAGPKGAKLQNRDW